MKAPFQPSRWWAIGTTIVCIAVVPTRNVTTPGLWISRAAQLNGADDYRTALMFANDTGWLLVGLLACWLPVHRLGRAMAAACALLMLLAMATGDFVPAIFLPLAVVGGGLHVCVWSLLLQHVLGLERHLRSAAVMLGEIVSGASYLVARGAVAPLLFAMNQRVSFALAAVAALLVGVAST